MSFLLSPIKGSVLMTIALQNITSIVDSICYNLHMVKKEGVNSFFGFVVVCAVIGLYFLVFNFGGHYAFNKQSGEKIDAQDQETKSDSSACTIEGRQKLIEVAPFSEIKDKDIADVFFNDLCIRQITGVSTVSVIGAPDFGEENIDGNIVDWCLKESELVLEVLQVSDQYKLGFTKARLVEQISQGCKRKSIDQSSTPLPSAAQFDLKMMEKSWDSFVTNYLASCKASASAESTIDDVQIANYCKCTLSKGVEKYGKLGFMQLSIDIGLGKKDRSSLSEITDQCLQ